MERRHVSSSNLRSVGYSNGVLEIEFISGGVYRYSGVPESVYQGLMNAGSKGSYYNKYIKDRFQ